ncbi:arylamine N-acetyltransferase [Glycomyces sp. TRM65418]|uniref:arylamine N-acetyltransferase family protein n=1 Tax=Glycomyces sp. TRM65418 TaxID=2867006 RepID=UPI001CE649F3|nr:arylamine N-acetyltransferase [Glycomyces sp. TRM65418]MCC3765481.1 arylamine N-acetyltransferase [Glycomyces sp. TRM65418]QZD55089.1 arylamine N-acetyltransferase [Glycomyces sp. TRM65418]
MFDSSQLAAYLKRIGISAPRRPTLHALRRVHRAHVAAMPYENLDIQLGRPIRLEADALFAKFVTGGRGGYCYEHNGVLAHALEAMGFDVRRVLGGVARETEGDGNWWNHMPLVVRFPAGEEYLADAGIGTGFRDPLPIRNGSYRVGAFNFGMWNLEDGVWRCSIDPRVTNLTFDFELEERQVGEFAAKCEELSTSPESPFVKTLTVQSPRESDMWGLRARTLTVYDPALPDGKTVTVVADRSAFADLLRGPFNLTLADAEVEALWAKAVEQHERKLAEEKSDQSAAPASR